MWRKNIGKFEEKYRALRIGKPNRLDSEIEDELKSNFLSDFDQLTLEARRKLVMESRVLVFLEWDIANAMIFY